MRVRRWRRRLADGSACLGDVVGMASSHMNDIISASYPDRVPQLQWDALRVLASRPFGRLRPLIRDSHQSSIENQLDAEATGFRECATTRDFAAGVSAFLSKRRASFEGR